MSYTKQVSRQTKKIRKQKFIIALAKHHLISDMPTTKKHSLTSNTKLIQNYQTNIEVLYQQTKLRTYPEKYNQSSERCFLCLNEKLAIALQKNDNMLTKDLKK